MSFNVDQVVISDGNYQYFRPSMINLKKEIKHEIPDYKNKKINTSILDSIHDLTMVDHPFDRLCFVRNKFKEMNISQENKNSVEIMVLLGIQHKLIIQKNQVKEFMTHYQLLVAAFVKKTQKCKYSIFKILGMNGMIEKKLFPLIQEKIKNEEKLQKFEKEFQDIENLYNYCQGKILFLSDENISKLGLVKD
jgi:hypothetical protein